MSWDWERLKDQQRKRGDIPPQMDDFIKKVNDFKMPGGPFLVLLLIIGLFSTSMFYTVKPSEEGVVQRFGKYVRTTQPGLHFKLPAGIETVQKVNVRQVKTEEFSSRAPASDPRFSHGTDDVTLMLGWFPGLFSTGLKTLIITSLKSGTFSSFSGTCLKQPCALLWGTEALMRSSANGMKLQWRPRTFCKASWIMQKQVFILLQWK